MDLIEILNNPLFIPLLVAVITIISNAAFLFWLRKWQYKAEYIITNVQKIYIPIVSEISDRVERLDKFLEHPSRLRWTFENMESIEKSGLFEFIKSHDHSLYLKLTAFQRVIPRELETLGIRQERTKQSIRADWCQHISNLISDTKAKEYVGMFVNEVLTDHMFVELLNGRIGGFPSIWNEKLNMISHTHGLYVPYVRVAPDRVLIARSAKTPTFDVSDDEIRKLIELSQPKLNALHESYKEVKALVEKEVVRGLVPMMQKYITNPLS